MAASDLALNDALWAVALVSSPRSLRSLSHASRSVHGLLSPVAERTARMTELTRALGSLPLQFHFPLSTVSHDWLSEAVRYFGTMKILRWREKAGELAGWVPTEEETWQLQSRQALMSILACAKWTLERVAPAKPLLFGATLRPATDSDRVTFAPLAFEWAEGPAADPLQLALQLSMSTEEVKLQVEMISGGWSDWSESWSLEAGTLQVEMSIAICGQDEGDKLMLHQALGAECLEVTGVFGALPCPVYSRWPFEMIDFQIRIRQRQSTNGRLSCRCETLRCTACGIASMAHMERGPGSHDFSSGHGQGPLGAP